MWQLEDLVLCQALSTCGSSTHFSMAVVVLPWWTSSKKWHISDLAQVPHLLQPTPSCLVKLYNLWAKPLYFYSKPHFGGKSKALQVGTHISSSITPRHLRYICGVWRLPRPFYFPTNNMKVVPHQFEQLLTPKPVPHQLQLLSLWNLPLSIHQMDSTWGTWLLPNIIGPKSPQLPPVI